MGSIYDVAIVGAGIVGPPSLGNCQVCFRYFTAGKAVDVAMGATKANSAVVHGGYAEPNTTLKGKLCYAGRLQFERLNHELNFGFRETGSLVVTLKDDPEPLKRLMDQGLKNGLRTCPLLEQTLFVKWSPI